MVEKLRGTVENTGNILESAREQFTDNIEKGFESAAEKEKSAERKEDIRNIIICHKISFR